MATQKYDRFQAALLKLKEAGYLATLEGRYTALQDHETREANKGHYAWSAIIRQVTDFVVGAHFRWRTAIEKPDEAGCGFVFRSQTNDDHYVVFLDSQRIIMRSSIRGRESRLGMTAGTGRVDFGNPAEADFFMGVIDDRAYVYVNDDFVGEYVLQEDAMKSGGLAYAIRSGANDFYGTECEITRAWLWQISP